MFTNFLKKETDGSEGVLLLAREIGVTNMYESLMKFLAKMTRADTEQFLIKCVKNILGRQIHCLQIITYAYCSVIFKVITCDQ